MEAAEQVCRQILESGEANPYALTFLSAQAQKRNDLNEASALLERLCKARPEDPQAWRELGRIQQKNGHRSQAVQSFGQALVAAPEEGALFAELALALQAAGREEQAARAMTRAFALDPELANARRNRRAELSLRELSQQGDDLLRSYHYRANQALVKELEETTGASLPARWSRFLDGFQGRKPVDYEEPRQQPDFIYYPRITARPFWPRESFEWLSELEDRTEAIRKEFLAVMADRSGFEPYVPEAPNAHEGWKKMAGKLNWASVHLIRGNRPVEENCRRCPTAYEALRGLPLVEVDGHAPEAFFSVLEPGTHIPPHYGVSNAKLAIHLPLIIPPDCAITVGGETQTWEEGRCLVFDDSFLHEAWNRSDQTRVVLIFETWNPDLSELERAALRAIIERGDAWFHANRELTVEDLDL